MWGDISHRHLLAAVASGVLMPLDILILPAECSYWANASVYVCLPVSGSDRKVMKNNVFGCIQVSKCVGGKCDIRVHEY